MEGYTLLIVKHNTRARRLRRQLSVKSKILVLAATRSFESELRGVTIRDLIIEPDVSLSDISSRDGTSLQESIVSRMITYGDDASVVQL